jgi:preprotein translocase subunit SecG
VLGVFKKNDGLGILFVMFCIIILFLFGLWNTSGDSDKQNKKKQEYKFEKVFSDVSGNMIKKAEFDLSDIARVNIE